MSRFLKVETIGIAVTLILIILYPRALFWDENYYYENVFNFLNPTISHIGFIKDLKGPAGPVYAYFHAIFNFATQGDGLYVRILNFSFLVLGILLSDLLQIKNNDKYLNLKLLLIPSFYPILGLALTETVPLIFSFFIVLNIKEISKEKSTLRFILLTILISLSILGRQQYLVVPIGLIVHQIIQLILLNKRFVYKYIIIALLALVTPLIYFALWGGIQPPSTSFVENGLSVEHFSLALFVAAIFDIIISEGLIKLVWNRTVGIIFFSMMFVQILLVGEYDFVPFHELTENTLYESLQRVTWLALLLIVSSYYLSVKIFDYFLSLDENNMRSVFILIYIGYLFTNIKVNHLFAARYVVPSIVFLLAIKNENTLGVSPKYEISIVSDNRAKVFVKCLLILVGVMHLISFYNYD